MTDDREKNDRWKDTIREDERRRLAREVHDSTSQLLVVIQLELGQLKREGNPEISPLIDQCQTAIEEIRERIRALGLD